MKAEKLYGKDETFQYLREIGAVNIYAAHKVLLDEQKTEIMQLADWSSLENQSRLNAIDKAIKHWELMTVMVYKTKDK